MALATRCPNCQALFRVVADQLKLRGGLVRCGSCRHVFDAIGSLTYVEDSALLAARGAAPPGSGKPAGAEVAAAPPPEPAAAPESAPPRAVVSRPSDADMPARHTDDARGARPQRSSARSPAAPAREAPAPELGVPTLLVTDEPAAVAAIVRAKSERARSSDNEAAQAALPARRRATRIPEPTEEIVVEAPAAQAEEEDADAEQPEFLRNEETPMQRGFSIVFGGGSLLLSVLLIAQLMVLFRTELVTRWPSQRPLLVGLCEVFDCTVGWPTRAELLAVVGSELQAVPGTDVLELTAIVRNRANFRVALPSIEVTLTDTQNRVLARKVFAPVDYLTSSGEPRSRLEEGIGAGADYTVKIAFEARGINAVGFVVYPFYL
jgi:predicted Zn finger-like uncharacterized protein